MFPVYIGKCLPRKAVHKWIERRGKCFANDEEVETEVKKWLRRQSEDFNAAGFDALVTRWDNVSMLVENMSINIFFFQFRISYTYVSRFTSICGLFTDSPAYMVPQQSCFFFRISLLLSTVSLFTLTTFSNLL
jgi:hypothetical protein